MKRVAVLTSGGDAPGMNAAIRSIVRTGIDKGWEMFGVRLGYKGLIEERIVPLKARDVSGILQLGGTMLGSARCLEFKTPEGQAKAVRTLNQYGIEALIVIGGNGSQTGSYKLSELNFPVVGVASTIDNDLYGSEITIGVDTALNIALESVDRLKTTASSHQRAFLIEVMGRDCGYLALMTGIAGGAEMVVIPEVVTKPEEVAAVIYRSYELGKAHAIVVVAEGAKYNAEKLMNYCDENSDALGFKLRATILGHVQRGGNPGAFDRIMATRLGAAAVNSLERGESGVLVGWVNGRPGSIPLKEVVSNKKQLDLSLLELSKTLF